MLKTFVRKDKTYFSKLKEIGLDYWLVRIPLTHTKITNLLVIELQQLRVFSYKI